MCTTLLANIKEICILDMSNKIFILPKNFVHLFQCRTLTRKKKKFIGIFNIPGVTVVITEIKKKKSYIRVFYV